MESKKTYQPIYYNGVTETGMFRVGGQQLAWRGNVSGTVLGLTTPAIELVEFTSVSKDYYAMHITSTKEGLKYFSLYGFKESDVQGLQKYFDSQETVHKIGVQSFTSFTHGDMKLTDGAVIMTTGKGENLKSFASFPINDLEGIHRIRADLIFTFNEKNRTSPGDVALEGCTIGCEGWKRRRELAEADLNNKEKNAAADAEVQVRKEQLKEQAETLVKGMEARLWEIKPKLKKEKQVIASQFLTGLDDVMCLLPRARFNLNFYADRLIFAGKSTTLTMTHSQLRVIYHVVLDAYDILLLCCQTPITVGKKEYTHVIVQIIHGAMKLMEFKKNYNERLQAVSINCLPKAESETQVEVKDKMDILLPKVFQFCFPKHPFVVPLEMPPFEGSYGVDNGKICPMPLALLFVHKPFLEIKYHDMQKVLILQPATNSAARYFSFLITMHPNQRRNKSYEFTNCSKGDIPAFTEFLQSKKVTVRFD